jgi:hypothetical protein
MITLLTDNARTREQLRQIAVPTAEDVKASAIWKPTPHGEFADTVVQVFNDAGYQVQGERWGVAGPNEEDLYGAVALDLAPDLEIPGGFSFALGIRHSNRLAFSHALTVGGQVLVCENGMLTGTRVLARKHTTGFDLREALWSAVEKVDEDFGQVTQDIQRLLALDLSGNRGDMRVDRTLVQAAREGLIAWSGLGKVDEAWRLPPHAEFAPRTGWSLYNAFTEVAKSFSNPGRQLDLLGGVKDLVLAGLN